jgi:hypothetical protein
MMLRRVAPAAIAAAALALAAPAAMANTTATGYAPPGNNQQHNVTKPKVLGVTGTGGPTCSESGTSGTGSYGSGCSNGPANAVVQASTSGSLPFTGFDLLLVLATGTGLLAAGFGLRRLTRRESAI